MSTLLLTLLIAFVIVAIAVGLLAIGWPLTGKSRMQAGACGRETLIKSATKKKAAEHL